MLNCRFLPIGISVLGLVAELQAAGELRRKAMFGAQLAGLTEEQREGPGLEKAGVLLKKVIAGTSAAGGGFFDGDIVVKLGGADVPDVATFLKVLSEK